MSKSGVNFFQMTFDRESGSYKPGETVSGYIVAEFAKPKKIRGLRLEILGESVVSWSVPKEHEGKTIYVTTVGREEYFSDESHVIGSREGRAIELPAGRKTYKFSFQLPSNIPSSLEHEFGYVRYTAKAVFDRPWKFNHAVKAAFTVVSNYDLNQKPQASLPIEEEIHKRFCCFCICPWGKLHAKISIPSTGFVPGQTIPVTVYCENESTVDVSKIKVILKMKQSFYASFPERSSREDLITVTETKYQNPFTTTFEDHVTVNLKVPSLPPSSLEYCGIIDLDYTLNVVLCFSGMHCSITRRFPILIGTVPLYSSFKTEKPIAVRAPSPSAPLQEEFPFAKQPVDGMPQSGSGMPQPGSSSRTDPTNPYFSGHWDSNNLPPPSYEESMYAAKNIRTSNDSQYVEGAGSSFAPRYPVYNYWPANTVPDAPPPYDEQ